MGANWTNFFIADVAAAASLTALLFVAISLRSAEIQAEIDTFARARGSFYLFAAALVVGLINLSPLPALYVGIGQAAACLFLILLSVPFTRAVHRAGGLRGNYPRVLLYYGSLVLMTVTGVLLAAGYATGVSQLLRGAAILAFLSLGVHNAWVLVLSHRPKSAD